MPPEKIRSTALIHHTFSEDDEPILTNVQINEDLESARRCWMQAILMLSHLRDVRTEVREGILSINQIESIYDNTAVALFASRVDTIVDVSAAQILLQQRAQLVYVFSQIPLPLKKAYVAERIPLNIEYLCLNDRDLPPFAQIAKKMFR